MCKEIPKLPKADEEVQSEGEGDTDTSTDTDTDIDTEDTKTIRKSQKGRRQRECSMPHFLNPKP